MLVRGYCVTYSPQSITDSGVLLGNMLSVAEQGHDVTEPKRGGARHTYITSGGGGARHTYITSGWGGG